MFDVRNFRPRSQIYLLLSLSLIAFSGLTAAQDRDRDKDDKEKESKKGNPNFVKVEGKVRCDKPDPAYSIDVPDRPGHALMISRRKCTWTEPMLILGAKTQDGVSVSFAEKSEGMLHSNGFETDTLDNGEKLTWKSMGQVLAEKGPATATGRWSLMRGTGKFKGIKGGGSYEEKLDADDVLVLELEGVYDPSEMVGEKK
ncbi:MAG: hypothetical protein WCB11_04630 [Terriglobales bacterium]|jgi:hypothetical protein